MPLSNFAELRRIRSEMSAEAGHDVRRFIELLDEIRQKHKARIVNHGAAEHRSATPDPGAVPCEEPLATATAP